MELKIKNASGKILFTLKKEDVTEEIADKLQKEFDLKGVYKYTITVKDHPNIIDCNNIFNNILSLNEYLIDTLEITLNEQ